MKSCLIIDDSRVVRKVISRITEDLGFEPIEAESGQEACEICDKSMPDAVIVNWHMPGGMSGIEFLKELRAMDKGNHPKVIFCTTENGIDQIKLAIETGADEYIMKPFDSSIIETKFIQTGLLS